MSELEIIRYVYINLGKKMNFDLQYTFGNKKQREVIFYRGVDDETLSEVLESRKAICKDLAYLITRILREFDINSEVRQSTGYDLNRHVYNSITLKDGRTFVADLEEDLEYIQSGSKTRYFGIKEDSSDSEQIITDEELKEMDKGVANYIPWGFYFDEMLKILKFATKGMNFEEKVKNVLDNLDVYVRDRSISYRERTYYHNRVLQEIFSKEELNHIHQIDCYRGEKENKEYVSCIVVDKPKKSDRHFYLYFESTGKYEEITLEELAAEVRDGLVLKKGIQGLRKYLKDKENINSLRKYKTETVKTVLDDLTIQPHSGIPDEYR